MKTYYDFSLLEKTTEVLRAVAHPARISIIHLLHQRGKMTVTEIYQHLDIQQAVASHHLRIMKGKGVVRVEREGKHSVYTLAHLDFYEVVRLVTNML